MRFFFFVAFPFISNSNFLIYMYINCADRIAIEEGLVGRVFVYDEFSCTGGQALFIEDSSTVFIAIRDARFWPRQSPNDYRQHIPFVAALINDQSLFKDGIYTATKPVTKARLVAPFGHPSRRIFQARRSRLFADTFCSLLSLSKLFDENELDMKR